MAIGRGVYAVGTNGIQKVTSFRMPRSAANQSILVKFHAQLLNSQENLDRQTFRTR
jgi:hypothetical protein